ncbi:ThuA domain-containing protein [Sphingobium sp. AR-3-1]|uniref:ThuA domain-containing protein n=1 Tax=Sphingobium psychrophilum TaxID=2728834 RepID=A0A7X9WXK0_9SPHN|nr:ThuA domain-containing protein [Sphingobium psychrophilum]NML11720.1 ThuA domain-containing protein [Sphingobium psychrophilum]
MKTRKFSLAMLAIGGAMASASGVNAKTADPLADCRLAYAPYSSKTPIFDLLLNLRTRAILNEAIGGRLDQVPARLTSTQTPSFATIMNIDQLMLRIGGGDVAATKAWLDNRLKTIPVTDADARARCARYDRDPPVLPAEISRPALLVFDKIDGFRDGPSVDAATAALKAIAQRKKWTIIFSDKGAVFNRRDLARFDAVVWNNVSGDVLTVPQEKAFQAYLAKGGGYAGIHGAGGDPTYIWDWYADKLLGARFIGHPMTPQFQEARVIIDDKSSVIARGLGDGWTMKEEWYSFDRSPRASGARIIARLDESSYNPVGYQGTDLRMGDHPIAWSRCIGNGRVFYSATGHHLEAYSNASNLTLMENGMSWAMGLEPSLCRHGKERPRQTASRTAGK